jgi:hypothetical protein
LNELVTKKLNATEIGEHMGFTKSAIQTKCYELKLSLNYHNKIIHWTPENIERLILLNNSKKTHNEIASEFGCSIPVISRILSQQKIRSKNVNFFTEGERLKLTQLFSEGHTINHIAKILNRSSPFLCRKAQELGLISEKSKLMREQLDLKKEGKRRCYKCKKIYPYTDEYFSARSICKSCHAIHRKGLYQSQMNNLTAEQLIGLRCRQAYQRACKKGREFNLTPENLLKIYNSQNGMCYYSGIKMEIALKGYSSNNYVLSIDRKDSHRGYTEDNVVLCCDAVNTMKMQMETDEFLSLCKKIVSNQIIQ